MAQVDLRNVAGAKVGTVELDDTIFGIEPNLAVLHQVVTAQLAAARRGTQSTKTRAEVRGGGKKPWKQKGTGRARQGSSRAPHWAGGGVALGPKPRDYRQRTPKKMIQLALRSALSDRAAEGRVAVIDAWSLEEPKTRHGRAALEALAFEGRVLVVIGADDDTATRALRNLPAVQLLVAGELNAYDVLCNDWIVFTQATLPTAPAAGTERSPVTGAALDAGSGPVATPASPISSVAGETAAAPATDPAPGADAGSGPVTVEESPTYSSGDEEAE